jgi:pimeloyl-ACP methyl ester carboxylesterase
VETAEVNGTRLAYELAGDGPPVVLVHGLALDRRMWDDQIGPLVGAGHRVLRYDLRGFGRSADPRPGEPYHHADDLRALMAHVGMAEAAIVGLSLGGWVALEFALMHPDATSRLVLVDPVIRNYSFPNGWNRNLVAVNETARREGLEAAKQRWLADPVFARSRQLPGVAARLEEMVGDYGGWQFLNDNPHRALDPPAIDRLGDVAAPTLIMVGESDQPDFHGMAELAAKEIPGAEMVVVPDAGHMSPMDAPDAFNGALVEFLGS